MKKVNKMSKYASNIYKRKDGRWEGIYAVYIQKILQLFLANMCFIYRR